LLDDYIYKKDTSMEFQKQMFVSEQSVAARLYKIWNSVAAA
jgi:hypothetical protein